MRGFLSGHIVSELQHRVWSERLKMRGTLEETMSNRQQMEGLGGHLGLSDSRRLHKPSRGGKGGRRGEHRT